MFALDEQVFLLEQILALLDFTFLLFDPYWIMPLSILSTCILQAFRTVNLVKT